MFMRAGRLHNKGREKISAGPAFGGATGAVLSSGLPLFSLETIETNGAPQVELSVSVPTSVGSRLVDRSSTGKDRKWSERKAQAFGVAQSYFRIAERTGDASYERAGLAVATCGTQLEFKVGVDVETGEQVRRLEGAHFCRDRLCPMCQWRKALVTGGLMMKCMEWVGERYDLVPLFLTLTVRNCEDDELGETLDAISSGWRRMMRGRSMKRRVLGSYRAIEVTRNSGLRNWHPHIHAVVLVPPEYFTDPTLYLDKAGWYGAWRDAMGLDYDPSIDVGVLGADGNVAGAVAEVCKYSVKPGSWEGDTEEETDHNVMVLREALRGRRMTSMTGVLKQAKAALKLEEAEDGADLVHTDEGDEETVVWIATEVYRWSDGAGGYVCSRMVAEPGVVVLPREGPPDAGALAA